MSSPFAEFDRVRAFDRQKTANAELLVTLEQQRIFSCGGSPIAARATDAVSSEKPVSLECRQVTRAQGEPGLDERQRQRRARKHRDLAVGNHRVA